MCWAACDRLAKVAAHLNQPQRARYWRGKAKLIRKAINEGAWNPKLNSYVSSFGGEDVDASLLLMREVGFVENSDPRHLGTLAAIEKNLRRENYLMRYVAPDDLGVPVNAFIVCTFWYVESLVTLGRADEAEEIFDDLLSRRNHLGLLSEDIDIENGGDRIAVRVTVVGQYARSSVNDESAVFIDSVPRVIDGHRRVI